MNTWLIIIPTWQDRWCNIKLCRKCMLKCNKIFGCNALILLTFACWTSVATASWLQNKRNRWCHYYCVVLLFVKLHSDIDCNQLFHWTCWMSHKMNAFLYIYVLLSAQLNRSTYSWWCASVCGISLPKSSSEAFNKTNMFAMEFKSGSPYQGSIAEDPNTRGIFHEQIQVEFAFHFVMHNSCLSKI